MSLESAFLQNILDRPEDDAARLIYADWLLERGDADSTARAEFIQLQIQLARMPRFDPARKPLEQREQKLLEQYGKTWAGPLRNLGHRFRRGFVEHVEVGAVALVRPGDGLFTSSPVTSVQVNWGLHNSGHEIADAPALARLRHLGFRPRKRDRLSGDAARRIILSPHLQTLHSLDFRDNSLTGASVDAFPAAAFGDSLTALDLSKNYLEAPTLRRLLTCHLGPRLERLWLEDLRLGNDDLRWVLEEAWFGRLRELSLEGNDLTAQSARMLAGLTSLRSLEVLNLSDNPVGTAGVRALAESRYLASLKELYLKRCELRAPAARALADSESLTALEMLNLDDNDIGDEGVEAILESPNLPRLRVLLVWRNSLSGGTRLHLWQRSGSPEVWH